jgi:T5SS/PEP-CTERM-associated repeat protein
MVWLRGEFHIADNTPATGDVLVTGGQLISTNDLVAIGRYGVGTFTITNATAVFTNASVGRHDGAEGTLTVQSNATVYALDAVSVARFTNSLGHVSVSGGLLSLTNDTLWVGREGAGDLTVSSGTVLARSLWVGVSENGTNTPQGNVIIAGGTTLLSSNLLVGSPGVSAGQLSVVGGSLTISNGTGAGLLNAANGTVTLNQGTLITDNLTMTNLGGQFVFNGGTLRVQNMTVANGTPFTVGDGVQPAVLRLDGGVCSFADGLVIAGNATVTGCGTILGPIVNHGTMATNCGVALAITGIVKTGAVATISFTSATGSNYILEYNTNANGTNWAAILPGVTGNGSVMSKQDPTATNLSRFYRIHVQ